MGVLVAEALECVEHAEEFEFVLKSQANEAELHLQSGGVVRCKQAIQPAVLELASVLTSAVEQRHEAQEPNKAEQQHAG